jgi:hypothetical protein
MATKIYSDIDFTFTKKPVTKDVALSYNEKAVLRSIRNLLSTRKFERPFNPDLGSNLDALLFELISPLTGIALEKECSVYQFDSFKESFEKQLNSKFKDYLKRLEKIEKIDFI